MNVEKIREMYSEGTQIILQEMRGESQMPYGLKGTVKFVDDAGQIHMRWENGSSLALNIDEDTFEKVETSEKISVILIEPDKYPKVIEIEDTLEAMQETVGGYIVFTADSFDKSYTEEERTYVVGSNNKAFIEGMGGYSIYASSLDGSDKNVRLEAYMADEYGGKDGWKIEKCYVKDESNREMLDIIAGKFFIAYAPIESEKLLSMPKDLMKKYEEKFKYPERFYQTDNGIVAKAYKPVSKDMER